MGSQHWSRLLAGSVTPWSEWNSHWSRFDGRTRNPAGGPFCSSLFLLSQRVKRILAHELVGLIERALKWGQRGEGI